MPINSMFILIERLEILLLFYIQTYYYNISPVYGRTKNKEKNAIFPPDYCDDFLISRPKIITF